MTTLMLKRLCAVALTLLTASCAEQPKGLDDAGGYSRAYLVYAKYWKDNGLEDHLTGRYGSSAILRLAGGSGVCVGPRAEFLVHEVRSASVIGLWGDPVNQYASATRDDKVNDETRDALPSCVQALFSRAMQNGNLTSFTGAQVLSACRDVIRPCD